jgi:hypothetical protein
MRHLKTFLFSEGRRYQDLVPCTDRILPNKSAGPKVTTGWAYGAATPEQDLVLLYFEKDCPEATITGVIPDAGYTASWFDPRNGRWIPVNNPLVSDGSGRIALPPFPDKGAEGKVRSDIDWAIKLIRAISG